MHWRRLEPIRDRDQDTIIAISERPCTRCEPQSVTWTLAWRPRAATVHRYERGGKDRSLARRPGKPGLSRRQGAERRPVLGRRPTPATGMLCNVSKGRGEVIRKAKGPQNKQILVNIRRIEAVDSQNPTNERYKIKQNALLTGSRIAIVFKSVSNNEKTGDDYWHEKRINEILLHFSLRPLRPHTIPLRPRSYLKFLCEAIRVTQVAMFLSYKDIVTLCDSRR